MGRPAVSSADTCGVGPFPAQHSKKQLFDLGIRVPMVVAGPGVATNKTCNQLVSAVDIWKRIADLSGAAPTTGTPADSHGFGSLLASPDPGSPIRDHVYSEIASKNGYTYSPSSSTWSPCDPAQHFGALPSLRAGLDRLAIRSHARTCRFD